MRSKPLANLLLVLAGLLAPSQSIWPIGGEWGQLK